MNSEVIKNSENLFQAFQEQFTIGSCNTRAEDKK